MKAAPEPRHVGAILGTMTFGDTVGELEASRIVGAALEFGVTEIDTANVYSGGGSESMLGAILPSGHENLRIATKVGIPHEDAMGRPPLSPDAIRLCVEGSLRRLRRDSVDLLYFHQPDRSTPLEESLQAAAELVEQGLVRELGVSNYSAWQIAEMEALAKAKGLPVPVVAQQVYSVIARRIEHEYAGFAATSDIRTVVYNPLAGGLLTGRYSWDENPREGRFTSPRLSGSYKDRYWSPEVFSAVEKLSSLAAEAGMSLVELALRWVATSPVIDSVLLGASSASQLSENIVALRRGPLEPALADKAIEATQALFGSMPAYNR